jgi:hypothetical protein
MLAENRELFQAPIWTEVVSGDVYEMISSHRDILSALNDANLRPFAKKSLKILASALTTDRHAPSVDT